LTGARQWADETDVDGDIAYLFESGHRSQSEANAIMERLFHNPKMKRDFRYKAHAFIDKTSAPALQAEVLPKIRTGL
jgi:hypothetical protein